MERKRVRPLSPGDLYLMKQLYGCELSPDGESLAVSLEATNKAENKKYSNLWLRPTRGGSMKQFTQGESYDHRPRFSPDGRQIAFLSSRSGKSQLHIIPVDGGESRQLTKLEGSVSEFCWAPDGRRLCVVFTPTDDEVLEREAEAKLGKKNTATPKVRHITRLHYRLDGFGFFPQNRSELHIIDAASGKNTLLLSDGKDNSQPVFTPDGQYVIFSSNKADDPDREFWKYELWRIKADGKGKLQKIETFDGPSSSPSVSPDGKWLAFTGHSDPRKMWNERNNELFVVPIGGGKPRSLSAKLDRPVENLCMNDTWGMAATPIPLWSPDSSSIYNIVSVDGTAQLYRFDVASGDTKPVFAETGVLLDFSVDFRRGMLYVNFSDIENPGDLYSRRLDGGGELKRLSSVNSSLLSKRDLGRVQELWVEGKGGHRIHGWVMTPPDHDPRKKYPGILYIHGGPSLAYGHSILHEFNYLAGLGYIVFFSNPRGSHTYGVKHLSAISRKWGDKDYEDVMSFTDAVLAKYRSIDPKRIGVTGGSYGGYLTNWIIGHTDRFKAAVTQRCVSNFLSFFGSSDVGFLFHTGFGIDSKTPWEDTKRFLEMSPMTYLHRAKTPTLVIHSENDLRCGIEQGEQVYTQLRLQGVETEFVRFPEESHGLSRGGRTDRRIERLQRISGWMDRYLKKN